jgi:hypothetical protein
MHREWDIGYRMSDGEFIIANPGVDRYHFILSYNTIPTPFFPALGSHSLMDSVYISSQFGWFLMARYCAIPSDPISMVHAPQLQFLMNSLRLA